MKVFGLNSQKKITLSPLVVVLGIKTTIFKFLAQKVSPPLAGTLGETLPTPYGDDSSLSGSKKYGASDLIPHKTIFDTWCHYNELNLSRWTEGLKEVHKVFLSKSIP